MVQQRFSPREVRTSVPHGLMCTLVDAWRSRGHTSQVRFRIQEYRIMMWSRETGDVGEEGQRSAISWSNCPRRHEARKISLAASRLHEIWKNNVRKHLRRMTHRSIGSGRVYTPTPAEVRFSTCVVCLSKLMVVARSLKRIRPRRHAGRSTSVLCISVLSFPTGLGQFCSRPAGRCMWGLSVWSVSRSQCQEEAAHESDAVKV